MEAYTFLNLFWAWTVSVCLGYMCSFLVSLDVISRSDRRQDSSVGIATGLTGWTAGVRFLAGA
jgi:hypothetical protein